MLVPEGHPEILISGIPVGLEMSGEFGPNYSGQSRAFTLWL